jgi:preprotein translocase subunit SecF
MENIQQQNKEHHQSTTHHVNKHWYDKYYKIMLFVPVAFLIFCLFYLASLYSTQGDVIYKDSSLAGGTIVTLNEEVDVSALESFLQSRLQEVHVRTIADIATGKEIAVLIDSPATPEELKPVIEEFIDHPLTTENSSIEFSGPSLGDSFYKQLIIAVIISFVLMSIVIFILFKTFVPSIAVIFAAFADIVMTLAFVDLLGVRLSVAGIAAFLMLIGYSVDTDILLTTRVLKNRGTSVNQRIYSSFKTGIFMTLTGLAAVIPAFLLITGLPDSFRQIFLIMAVGLFADIINTWLTNASIIKWYADYKKL